MKPPVLKGYQVLNAISENDIARIWLVRHIKSGRLGTLKLYLDLPFLEPSIVEAFRSSILEAATLKHPNLAATYNAGGVDGFCFVVSEYVEGDSAVIRVANNGAFSESEVLAVGDKLTAALKYACEEAGIYHSNIKPGSIVFSQSGVVKLMDMGSALTVGRLNRQLGVMVGAPNYMPLEQFQSERSFDYRVDIYALGATLYYLSTGFHPFDGLSATEIMQQQISGKQPDPRDVNPLLSPSMARLIMKLMTSDLCQRPGSWDEVTDEINRARQGIESASPISSPVPPMPPTQDSVPTKEQETVASRATTQNKSPELAMYRQKLIQSSHSRRIPFPAIVIVLLAVAAAIVGMRYALKNPTPKISRLQTAPTTPTPIPEVLKEPAPTPVVATPIADPKPPTATPSRPLLRVDEKPALHIIPDILAQSPATRSRILWQAGKLNGLPKSGSQGLIADEFAALSTSTNSTHIRQPDDMIQQLGRKQAFVIHLGELEKSDAVVKIALRSSPPPSEDLRGGCDYDDRRLQVWFNNERIWWRWLPQGHSIIEAYVMGHWVEDSDNLLTIESEAEPLCIDAIWVQRQQPGPRIWAALQDGYRLDGDAASFVSSCAMRLPPLQSAIATPAPPSSNITVTASISRFDRPTPPTTMQDAISSAETLKDTERLIGALDPAQKEIETTWNHTIISALRRGMLPVIQTSAGGDELFWNIVAQRYGPFVGHWILTGSQQDVAKTAKWIRARVPKAEITWDGFRNVPDTDGSRLPVDSLMFHWMSGYWGGRTDRALGRFRLQSWHQNAYKDENFDHWLSLSSPYLFWRDLIIQRKHADAVSQAMLQWWMAGGNKIVVPGAEPGGLLFPEGAGKPSVSWSALRWLFKLAEGMPQRSICNVIPSDAKRAWGDTCWIAASDEKQLSARIAIFSGLIDESRTANITLPVPWQGRTVCSINSVVLHNKKANPEPQEPRELELFANSTAARASIGKAQHGYVELSLPLTSVQLLELRPAHIRPTKRRSLVPGNFSTDPPLVQNIFHSVQTPLPCALRIAPLRKPYNMVECLTSSWQSPESQSATVGTVPAWRLDAPDSAFYATKIFNVTPWNKKSTVLVSLEQDGNDDEPLQTARIYWDTTALVEAQVIAFWVRAKPKSPSDARALDDKYASIILGTENRRQQIKVPRDSWQMFKVQINALKDDSGVLPSWLSVWRAPSSKGAETFEFNGFVAIGETDQDGTSFPLIAGKAYLDDKQSELTIVLTGQENASGHWYCRLPQPVKIEDVDVVDSPDTIEKTKERGNTALKFSYDETSQVLNVAIKSFPNASANPPVSELPREFISQPFTSDGRTNTIVMIRCKLRQ